MSIVNDKMSDTPETDAARITEKNGCIATFGANQVVSVNFARRLERERDEAITRRMETIMQCELYEQERDEAIIELSKLKAALRQRFEEGK